MENKSGLQPVDTKVLVKPDTIEEKTGGGLYLPDTVRDKEFMAQFKATLVAVGGNAFQDPPWSPPIPQVGDRLYIHRNTGIKKVTGADGEYYQFINDEDIIAIITEE